MAATGCFLLSAPYLAANWIGFAHLQPVSAAQKMALISPLASWKIISQWSVHQFMPRVQHILGLEWMAPQLLFGSMLLMGMTLLVYLITGTRRLRTYRILTHCPEFSLFVAAHALFIVLVAPQEAATSAWYWVPEILLLALAFGVTLENFSFAKIPLIPLAVALMTALQLVGYPILVQRKTMSFAKMEAAKYLRENTPPYLRGAMCDSGIVSYFSQRDFLGINGLIGDFEHAQQMREKRYAEAFERCGVSFLVLDTPLSLLDRMPAAVSYITDIHTKFFNFSEPPKPFVVYSGSPEELAAVWNLRYP